jgi:hypothetical protein
LCRCVVAPFRDPYQAVTGTHDEMIDSRRVTACTIITTPRQALLLTDRLIFFYPLYFEHVCFLGLLPGLGKRGQSVPRGKFAMPDTHSDKGPIFNRQVAGHIGLRWPYHVSLGLPLFYVFQNRRGWDFKAPLVRVACTSVSA